MEISNVFAKADLMVAGRACRGLRTILSKPKMESGQHLALP